MKFNNFFQVLKKYILFAPAKLIYLQHSINTLLNFLSTVVEVTIFALNAIIHINIT